MIKKLKHIIKKKTERGSVVLLVLVFTGVMTLLLGGTSNYVLTQHRAQLKKAELEFAVQIAEAGVDYYRWFLSHYPDDLQDDTGDVGPYEHEYSDPEGGAIGKFSLNITGNAQCGSIYSVDIESTGWTYNEPGIKRTVKARYARPSVAEYAYIIDDNVWAGSDRSIKGKYHSNGGIRMDGTNDSLVTSAQEIWNCTSSFGCDSPYEVKDGVFGSGSGSALWSYPAEEIDFTNLTLDLVQMKTQAQASGIYLPVSTDLNSKGLGYNVIFKDDGTFDVYIVTKLGRVRAYKSDKGWVWNYESIKKRVFYNNYAIPTDCSLVFVEDDLWVEGMVEGKTTIVSADLITPNVDTDVILNWNILYNDSDGSDGLLVVGENDVMIPLESPDAMELNGIFVAQKGSFGRDYYNTGWPLYDRDFLKINGSIVSKGRVGTSWSCGGSFCSGYRTRINSYDRKLMTDPPPMTPFSDDEYRFIKWEEKQ